MVKAPDFIRIGAWYESEKIISELKKGDMILLNFGKERQRETRYFVKEVRSNDKGKPFVIVLERKVS